MEVLMGATSAAAYIRDQNGVAAQDTVSAGSAAAYVRDRSGIAAQDKESAGAVERLPEESPESSSSIGAAGDSSEGEEEEDDVVWSEEGLSSFSSLQDSLPIKRGLSNHYVGKSKSFGNLSEAGSVKDLEKPENPFNKKRRVLMASKRRATSFYSWQKNPKSMPLLAALHENEEEDGERETQITNMKTSSCVSLAELHEDNE